MKRLVYVVIFSLLLALPALGCSSGAPEATATPAETSTPAPTPTVSASNYREQGLAKYEAGELDAAMADYQQALELEPGNADAHAQIAKIYLDREQYADALAQYELALENDSGHEDAVIGLCVSFAFVQPDQAEVPCQAAQMLQPNNPDVHNALGVSLALQGREDEALKAFEEAVRLDPEHDWAHNNLGYMYLNQGLFAEAIAELNIAIGITPENAKAYNNLGIAYARQGNYDQAIPAYEEAIRLNPEIAPAYFDLGLIYNDLGQAEKAIEYFEKFLELSPDTPDRAQIEALVEDLKLSQTVSPGTYVAFEDGLEATGVDDGDIFSFFTSSGEMFQTGNASLAVLVQPEGSLDISIVVLDATTGEYVALAEVNNAGPGGEEYLETALPVDAAAIGVYEIRIISQEGTGAYRALFSGTPEVGFFAASGWEIQAVLGERMGVFFVVSTLGKAGEPISIGAAPYDGEQLDLVITAVDSVADQNLGTLNEGGPGEPESDSFTPDSSVYLFIVGDQDGQSGQAVLTFSR